ncbi:MAG: hypothetical protein HEP71_09275 [Roseivirga sp.]|nr:hypothetical protein [Roseivirga sp.]
MKNRLFPSIALICFLLSSCDSYEIIESYPSGQIKLKCQKSDGLIEGVCVSFYENGQVEFYSRYTQGERHGVSDFFHPNGVKHWSASFENGIKNGKIDYYDSMGVKYQSAQVKDNQLDGVNYEYYKDGTIKTKAMYTDGQLDGELLRYNDQGSTIYTARYKNGDIEDFKEYGSAGKLELEMLKFSIGHDISDTGEVELYIEVHNPQFDILLIEIFDYIDIPSDSVLNVQDEFFSVESLIKYPIIWPEGRESIELIGYIYDVDSLENGEGAVIKNEIDFYYKIDKEGSIGSASK